jgi:hypothetical protein
MEVFKLTPFIYSQGIKDGTSKRSWKVNSSLVQCLNHSHPCKYLLQGERDPFEFNGTSKRSWKVNELCNSFVLVFVFSFPCCFFFR